MRLTQQGVALPTDASGVFLADGGEQVALSVGLPPGVEQTIRSTGPVLVHVHARTYGEEGLIVPSKQDFVFTMQDGAMVGLPVAQFVEMAAGELRMEGSDHLHGRAVVINHASCLLWRGDKVCHEALADTATVVVDEEAPRDEAREAHIKTSHKVG
jgi:hypothetical protein